MNFLNSAGRVVVVVGQIHVVNDYRAAAVAPEGDDADVVQL